MMVLVSGYPQQDGNNAGGGGGGGGQGKDCGVDCLRQVIPGHFQILCIVLLLINHVQVNQARIIQSMDSTSSAN